MRDIILSVSDSEVCSDFTKHELIDVLNILLLSCPAAIFFDMESGSNESH